ncbi:MAG: DUF2490 domain-containing protein [Sandaracinus sp.]|nr:DUF2490 domain-containing protein [Sandaracinus sp.]MCB9614791.1 DUF2490 domain-containing protein [Sandaracinus sp.]MCB9631534.1 DUF2490 domain-containing protein [Sandaracinus sp.]
MKRTFWIVSMLALAAPAAAQPTTHGNAVWAGLIATQDLTPGTPGPSLWLDAHMRREESGTNVLVRPGVGFRVFPWLSLWAGYAWTPSFPDAPGAARVDEHRLWEQVIASHAFGPGLSLQSRTRFEHRFGENSDEVAHRFRQFVRFAWMHETHPIGVVVWDELFVGFRGAEWGAASRYDQNRLFVGPVFKIAPWARVEPGYLFVHLDRTPNRVVHAVAVNLFLVGKR